MGAQRAAGCALRIERAARVTVRVSDDPAIGAMSLVRATIDIAAAPEQVWETVMDPSALGDWVTIHRKLVRADAGPPREGFKMDQQIQLRGVTIEVHWELAQCEPARLAVWEGRGPARSRAHTEYRLQRSGNGTQFDYRNEFHSPLGPLGAMVSRALVGGIPEREAKRTLERLRQHVEHRAQRSTSVR
jgi:carbon monoxide dehydrogenase subunit G